MVETACATLPSCSQSASTMSSSASSVTGRASSTTVSTSTMRSPSTASACWRWRMAALACSSTVLMSAFTRSSTVGSGSSQLRGVSMEQMTGVRHAADVEEVELAGAGCWSSGMVPRRTWLQWRRSNRSCGERWLIVSSTKSTRLSWTDFERMGIKLVLSHAIR